MSIIHEALKKAGHDLTRFPSIGPVPSTNGRAPRPPGPREVRPPQTEPSRRGAKPAPRSQRRRTYGLLLILILLGVLAPRLLPPESRTLWRRHTARLRGFLRRRTAATTPSPAPVVPKRPPRPPEEGPVLQGILTGKNGILALIDGDVYEPGDEIDGMRITRILPDRVMLQGGGHTRTLELSQGR